MKKLRKVVIVSVMFMTVLSMSVVAAPNANAAASAGDLIKMDGLSSVYYLAADGKRYVFPNEQTYLSWYSDFSSVVTIPQSELEGYPLGANVTMRPGTKLVKITTDPKVYAVESNGSLVHVASEAAALALYGSDWASRVVDVPDAFFTNYEVSASELDGTAYPEGSLIKTADSADIYYIAADGTARKIADEAAMSANRLENANVITTTLAIPTAGTEIAGAESTLTDTSSGAGGTAGAGTGLTIALASDTQVAANIPAGSPNAFLKLNLTASSDGDVSVSVIKLSAYDLGTATYIDSVTFYDDGVKVGTSKNVNSDRVATFNFSTPIEVAAGTTKSLLVKATIEAAKTGNFALGIASASDVTTDGAAVSGTFPVQGNTQAIVSGTSIGTVAMSSVGESPTTNNFGEDNVLLASFNLAAANEAILWESMRLKNGGTNTDGIVGNMKVLIDGDEVVGGAELVSRFINFDMGNFRIAKNDTISVEVYGDIGIANVNNTVDLYFDDANDLVFTGESYGYGIQITAGSGNIGFADLNAVSDGIVVTLAAGDVTIDMNKTATPAKDVRPDDTDVVIATFSIVSSGENATITAIGDGADTFYLSGTTIIAPEIENVELKDVDTGAIYDVTHATSTATDARIALTVSDTISLVKGVTKTFELRIDLNGPTDSYGADNNDTYQATLTSSAFTITGDDSDGSLQSSITPSSVSGAIMTVKTASLTWQTTPYSVKTIVGGASDVLVYSAGVKAGESSDVTLTTVTLTATTTLATAFTDTNVSQLRLYIDGELAKTSSGNITERVSGTAGYITFTSLDTSARVIPAGKTVTVEVKADFAGTFNPSGWIELEINDGAADIIAKDVDNNNVVESVSNVGTLSRSVRLASNGTLKVELLTTDVKANGDSLILAGGTKTSGDKYLAQLKMTTANEQIKVKTLVIGSSGNARSDDVKAVVLYDDNEVEIAREAMDVNGQANFNSLNLLLDADSTNKYYLGVDTVSIDGASGSDGGTADDGETITLHMASTTGLVTLGLSADQAVTAIGNESGNAITCVAATSATVATGEYAGAGYATSTTQTLRGIILTSITSVLDNGTLTAGNNKIIGKYKFMFDNGDNRQSTATGTDDILAQMIEIGISFATSSNVSVANVQVYNENDSSNKTTAVEDNAGIATSSLLSLTGDTENVDGEVTLVVEADVSGTLTSGDYLQTSLVNLDYSFQYAGLSGAASTPIYTLLINKSEVQGATLTN